MAANTNSLIAGDWEAVFQVSIDAYYQGDLDAGRAACERLLSRWDLPGPVRAATLRNASFYAEPLQRLIPETVYRRLSFPVPTGWTAYNPSILNSSRGLLVAVRSSNWEFKRHHYFRVHAEDGIARSQTYLLQLDASLAPASVELLEDDTDRTSEVSSLYRGYNDVRLFEQAGKLRAIATTLDFSAAGISQMALLEIVGSRLRNVRLLSDGVSRTEKNWTPVVWNDELLFVYQFAPFLLLRWDGTNLLPAGHPSYRGVPIAVDFRGGSQLVPVDGGFLTVIHCGADFSDGSRVYLHRFVSLDHELRVGEVSPPFTFLGNGVEFAAGLANINGNVIVSFGVADAECWLAVLPLDGVRRLLSRPEDLTITGSRSDHSSE